MESKNREDKILFNQFHIYSDRENVNLSKLLTNYDDIKTGDSTIKKYIMVKNNGIN